MFCSEGLSGVAPCCGDAATTNSASQLQDAAGSRAPEPCRLCFGCSVGEMFPRKQTDVSPHTHTLEIDECIFFLPLVHHRVMDDFPQEAFSSAL